MLRSELRRKVSGTMRVLAGGWPSGGPVADLTHQQRPFKASVPPRPWTLAPRYPTLIITFLPLLIPSFPFKGDAMILIHSVLESFGEGDCQCYEWCVRLHCRAHQPAARPTLPESLSLVFIFLHPRPLTLAPSNALLRLPSRGRAPGRGAPTSGVSVAVQSS